MAEPIYAPDELDLRDYLQVLRRRAGVIVLSVIVVVAGALVASFLQTPIYQGHAELLLQNRSSEALFDPQTGAPRNPERDVQTEIEVIKSEPVQRAVEDRFDTEVPDVRASVVGDTDVVRVSAEHTDPEQAAAIANAYAQAYIDFRRTQNVNDRLEAAQIIQDQIDELQAQIDAIGEGAGADGERQAQRNQLINQQALFRQQLDQLQVGAALTTGGAQLVTAADAPDEPVRPTPVRSGILAAVVGLFFGVGLAFLFDYLDDSVRDRNDLERATGHLPVLGLIPRVAEWKKPDQTRLVSLTEPDGVAAEAYRALRTSLQFIGLDQPLRSLQITSASAREGKTTTAANLAVLFAKAGKRTVVVDCDLRRPRLHDFFHVPDERGFTSVLMGEVPLSEVVQPVDGVPDLWLLPSGPVPPLPSEMLSSHRTGEVIASLESEFDLVLIDSPPTVPVTDATVLATWVDGLLVVATADLTSRRALQRASEVLSHVDAKVLGTVLNRVEGTGAYGDTYGYGYAPYGARSPEPQT